VAAQRLIKRLRHLWTGEPFDGLFFPAVVVFLSRAKRQPVGLFATQSVAGDPAALAGGGLVVAEAPSTATRCPHMENTRLRYSSVNRALERLQVPGGSV
jgi:hypothetical protein